MRRFNNVCGWIAAGCGRRYNGVDGITNVGKNGSVTNPNYYYTLFYESFLLLRSLCVCFYLCTSLVFVAQFVLLVFKFLLMNYSSCVEKNRMLKWATFYLVFSACLRVRAYDGFNNKIR